jgi:hypothetical protein
MKELMRTRMMGIAAVFVLLGLCLGYYLGHRDGLQEERRAWLATRQFIALPRESVGADGSILQRPGPHTTLRAFYSNPHAGRLILASGPRPVNAPDLRTTPVK